MKINAALTAVANIFALVNAANAGLNLDATLATVGAPVVKADTGDGRNTSVTLTAVAASGFAGAATVNYVRRGLNDSVLAPVDTVSVDDGVTKATIITSIAGALGLVVSELDLTGDITRPAGSDTSVVNLVSIDGSLLYVDGSTQALTLNWAHHDTDLGTAVATTDMTGFDAAS